MIGISSSDRQVIRDLAKQVAELAARPSEAAKIAQWKRHNRFERGRALLVVRLEDVWDEFVPVSSLACQHEPLRQAERILRQRLYMAEHIRDDTPVDGGWDVYLKVADPGYGSADDCRQLAQDGHGRTGAKYCKVIPDGADPDKLKMAAPEAARKVRRGRFRQHRSATVRPPGPDRHRIGRSLPPCTAPATGNRSPA